jgi:hypothetical protein
LLKCRLEKKILASSADSRVEEMKHVRNFTRIKYESGMQGRIPLTEACGVIGIRNVLICLKESCLRHLLIASVAGVLCKILGLEQGIQQGVVSLGLEWLAGLN